MQTISTQVLKNPILNHYNFPRTPIHLWISGAPEQETPSRIAGEPPGALHQSTAQKKQSKKRTNKTILLEAK